MENIESSGVLQSPLNDQKKGKGFVLGNKSISDSQSFNQKSSSSKNYGKNFFSHLGMIAIVLAVIVLVKSISTDFKNSQTKNREYALNFKSELLKNSREKRASEAFKIWKEKEAKENEISVELKKINERLDKLDKNRSRSQVLINSQDLNKNIEYLKNREKAKQLGELGNMITTFNNLGLFSWMN